MRMQTKSYAPSGHYSAESIAISRYSLAMLSQAAHALLSSSGSLAMFAAMRYRASWFGY
jgi:hypothetical protein